jgi:2-oxoglutarate dehydrogenase E2 component (dihydrolipoamide succinyltransferase)
LHPRINLGIAVDLGPEGLIVPVVKDADQKSLPELARAIHSLVEKARAHQLAPDELTEGTYTLSNSGSFGTLLTAPIINPPQVAILSIDGVVRKPLVVEGTYGEKVVIRPIGVLAQSFDHRAFDGAYSAAYLRRLKEILQAADWSAALESTSGSPTRER